MGKVIGDFLGRQVNVRKNHDASLRLLDNLRAPACFAASVETLAALEAHQLKCRDQVRRRARHRAIGVVIVIGLRGYRAGFVVHRTARRPA